MKIEITARNFKPSPYLKSFIEVRLRTLLKYDSHITSFKVVLLKEGRAEKVELIITSNKGNYITKCYTSVFEKTVINAIEKIKVQINNNHPYKQNPPLLGGAKYHPSDYETYEYSSILLDWMEI
jgi:ribosomal subunit interface protein